MGRAASMVAVLSVLFLAGCERAVETPMLEQNPEPVVVYASYNDQDYLPEYFQAFTEVSGIRVVVRNFRGAVDDAIADHGSPPADVLLTPDVSGIWQATEEGALRPLGSERLQESVPEWLRDPDGYWVALSLRTSVLALGPATANVEQPQSYQDLADPRYRSKLCLSSSSAATNRTVIAMLIEEMGVRPAEIVVRGWMQNLAVPVFAFETELLEAVESGQCPMAIVSSDNLQMLMENAEVAVGSADFTASYANAEGVGITRHARNPESAAMLIEWMLSDSVQAAHAEATYSYPVADSSAHALIDHTHISISGWWDLDAAMLAERAAYR
jgi:iron(III) transport system substrate-binding protein